MLYPFFVKLIFTMSHPKPNNLNRGIEENPPTNISAMVKFITKNMARVRRFLFFIKRIIDRRFTATTATDSIRKTANQVLHSGEEIIIVDSVPVLFPLLFNL